MVTTDQKILRKKSKNFNGSKEELDALFYELEKELENSKIHGVGLSAIQIKKPLNVSIIRTKNIKLNLYNAKILDAKKPLIFQNEGCLSIPNVFEDTLRFGIVKIKNGDGQIFELEGYEAVVVQHETDHCNGILFIDRKI